LHAKRLPGTRYYLIFDTIRVVYSLFSFFDPFTVLDYTTILGLPSGPNSKKKPSFLATALSLATIA